MLGNPEIRPGEGEGKQNVFDRDITSEFGEKGYLEIIREQDDIVKDCDSLLAKMSADQFKGGIPEAVSKVIKSTKDRKARALARIEELKKENAERIKPT